MALSRHRDTCPARLSAARRRFGDIQQRNSPGRFLWESAGVSFRAAFSRYNPGDAQLPTHLAK